MTMTKTHCGKIARHLGRGRRASSLGGRREEGGGRREEGGEAARQGEGRWKRPPVAPTPPLTLVLAWLLSCDFVSRGGAPRGERQPSTRAPTARHHRARGGCSSSSLSSSSS
ncbi:unnamed protein product, partial [Prorocentrum cordatum]